MAVFDWMEDDNATLSSEVRMRETQFGDGYLQRSPDGLNPVAQEIPLSFSDLDVSVADAIEAFLLARNGVEAFDWTPLWRPTGPALRVTCKRWARSHNVTTRLNTITASFMRVYEP